MTPASENELSAMSKDPQRLIRVPIGAVSPLWGLFAGAAVSGAAWWWMTRWARPANLEAVLGAAEQAKTEVETAPEVVETAIADIPPLPVAEALIEAAPEAVGGEAAPISPVLEALSPEVVEAAAEPKLAPKPKKAAPKAD